MTAQAHIATVKEIVEQIRGDGSRTVEQQMSELFDRFIFAARQIDPAISGQLVGYEVDEQGRSSRPAWIGFERNGKPMFGVGGAA